MVSDAVAAHATAVSVDLTMPGRHIFGVDVRHLRYFVAAVEAGSLQAAARRMNVAQPALSRRIHDLEADLACALLMRGVRGVTPTRAGAAFYRDTVALLDDLDRATRTARQAGQGQGLLVRFGIVQSARKYGFLQQAIAAFRALLPQANIAFTRLLSPDLSAGLREGRLDLTLLYERHLGSHGFGERLIHKERYVLAVHPGHRLATPHPAELAELAGEPLVWLSRRDDAANHDKLMQQCRLQGLEPSIAQLASNHEEQIDLTAVTGGVCLTPASTMLSTPPGMLSFRPLPDFDMELQLSLAWRADTPDNPNTALLEQLHLAISSHQAAIAAGTAAWARLCGHVVALAGP